MSGDYKSSKLISNEFQKKREQEQTRRISMGTRRERLAQFQFREWDNEAVGGEGVTIEILNCS